VDHQPSYLYKILWLNFRTFFTCFSPWIQPEYYKKSNILSYKQYFKQGYSAPFLITEKAYPPKSNSAKMIFDNINRLTYSRVVSSNKL